MINCITCVPDRVALFSQFAPEAKRMLLQLILKPDVDLFDLKVSDGFRGEVGITSTSLATT